MKANRLLLTAILSLTSIVGVEAADYIRYVSKRLGAYNNDGTTWKTAKVNVQDAINDIKDKIGEGDRGFVFVESGTYKPTQSVVGAGTSTLYMSIQIPAGVRVYGGFAGTEEATTAQSIIDMRETVKTEVGTFMKNRTIFTGSLSTAASFEWNDSKHRYSTSFYGNCYHVVWFATNGYTTDEVGVKHYNALSDTAILDGVVIRDGYAFNRDINKIEHNAFGGGAYLVGNAIVRNCEVFHCEASRSGGGLYLDNGGRVENCYVHDCQSLGVNSTSGFGGGIAVKQNGVVTHSAMINNVGRSGGGLSLNFDPTLGLDGQYAIAASACLVAQNVATVEAGGVYLDKGGLMNGMTIVKNKTFGTGVTLNGIVTGRSGGVYVRDHARIYNSVMWGNETNATNTNNLQYAATRSSAEEKLKPSLSYVALSQADYTDWSGTKKIGISKLDKDNSGEASGSIKYPLFDKHCITAGHVEDQAKSLLSSSGSYVQQYRWHPTASSGLCYAGLQLLDILESYSQELSAGFILYDLKGLTYSPKCALGAYTADIEMPKHVVLNGKPTIFVDPNRASGSNYENPGTSWDNPMYNLSDALSYFKNNKLTGQILVKEGTLYTAGRSASGRMRGTTIQMVSNVAVLGGYSSLLRGTDVSKRNPVANPTIISGRVVEGDYSSNVAHLVTFDGVSDATLDGFQLRWANALSTAIAEYGKEGAGIVVKGGSSPILKNLSISDCTASAGAAIYVENGEVIGENCIFRNCESEIPSDGIAQTGGILYIASGSAVELNHCDVVRNVGYAVVNNGTLTTKNTLFYSNMKEAVEDTNNKGDLALPAFFGAGSYAGNHNLFDTKSENTTAAQLGQTILDWTFSTSSTTYPRFVNSTKNAGVSESGDFTYYGLTVDYTPSDMNPAVNAATTDNVSHVSALSDGSWGYDMTTVASRDFGGLPDIGALENGAVKANSATQPRFGTTIYVRDYNTYNYDSEGQIVSTKTSDLEVTHADGTSRDGSSWKNAINGNANYGVSSVKGLQLAVNNAFSAMSSHFVTRQETGSEKHNGGSVNTIRTYYDFVPTDDNPEVSVWVGAGIYYNPGGFEIRNHVKVYGGFPKEGNPGMNERHPQLTTGIPLSKANRALNLKVSDYETILQTNNSIEERNSSTKSVSVLAHPQECRVTTSDDSNVHRDRVVYEGAEWDGFTMRYGRKDGVYGSGSGRRQGGAGVSLYENVILRNCIVRDNYLGISNNKTKGRGAGVYCDGSKVVNCYLMNNESHCTQENYGGGLYMILGTMYNTVVSGNSIPDGSSNHGNGVFFESANFYNNTIVNNRGGDSSIGVYTASANDAHLTVYNSIVMAGTYPVLWKASQSTPANFNNCYLHTSSASLYTSGISAVLTEVVTKEGIDAKNANPFVKEYNKAVGDYDFRITLKTADYNCVNKGTELLGKDYDNVTDVVLPDNDMDWTRRVQDCRVDIGAYEYNGADDIHPDTDENRVGKNCAVFYVTERGFGTTQANDPANAACAEKLQKVLDAAGRYKYAHSSHRVIVKLAGVDALAADYEENSCFKYYPCRTTDEGSDNVRVWSIMVPRGVEVWGGYSVADVLEKTSNEDIAPCFTENERSAIYHPTYLQTQYDNTTLNEVIKGYHVVTFTEKLFDENGVEIANQDLSGIQDRAVLDGLFLVGGQADGESLGTTSSTVNINQYGGAAIVTSYSHVRNCIVKGNTATFGGALALMNKGLVSGSLIIDNEASYGGGIYVFEDGVVLSSGETNNTTKANGALDENMPHVYTSTIVKNTGKQQGGGLWFSNEEGHPNVRVNSSVLWQNDSPDQANVAGQTSPDMPEDASVSTFEWYPFAYSAVQNLRISGTSNISVDIQNRNGNRFGIDSKTDSTLYDGNTIAQDTTEIDFYGLTIFSALCRTGMPCSSYEDLVNTIGLSKTDYNKWSRDTIPAGSNPRSYVDIGARAYPSSPIIDLNHPFLRLFVAQTQDVDMDAYQSMQDYASGAKESDANYVYGLLGSSFAYPFQNLDDALEYIVELRKSKKWGDKLKNVPFEICISRGDYYPQRDMQGNYGYSLANTFLIPEGVTLMGGFDCNDLYGQYWKPAEKDASEFTNIIRNNVDRFSSEEYNIVGKAQRSIVQIPLDTMANHRVLEDLNMNNILEPWEFQNQTNLSGNTVNLQNSGVYHVVSVVPYAPGVGQLPTPTYVNPDYEVRGQTYGYGKESKEIGQPVVIDGVHISDGYARDYVEGSLTDIGIFDYNRGAGLQGTGNWYCSKLDGSDDDLKHQDVENAIAYRDIPLYIRNSQFINNQAGYGAAMDVNISTYIYNCLFAQNKAISHQENVRWVAPTGMGREQGLQRSVMSYPGNGGAIHFNNKLEVYNTIFSNNEAEDPSAISAKNLQFTTYKNLQNQNPGTKQFGGAGGALCGGPLSHLKALNCDFVNNRACIYPAIYTMNPNRGIDYGSFVNESQYNLVANTVFWGNDVPQAVNSNFAQQLCINVGRKNSQDVYDLSLSQQPVSQEDLDKNFSEAVWFSAYENGRAASVANNNDFRKIQYLDQEFIGKTIHDYWTLNYSEIGEDYEVQNANISLSSDNDDLEGPNFCNPSTVAGYDGYNEAADWSRARLNNLTDNGSCFLQQNVVNTGKDGYIVNWKTDIEGHYDGNGAFYLTYYQNKENKSSLDLGSDIYMRSVATSANMPRVAADPSPTHPVAYIDLGVYEYPHCKLVPSVEGDAVDVLWVSTLEHPENGTPDGKRWETPTSDLQRAIETLMSSRNGHRKEIRMMNGEYAPIYTNHGFKAFYLNTMDLNNSVYFDDDAYDGKTLKYDQSDIDNYFVRSLTIKGGYSRDLRDQYDTEIYPVTLRAAERQDGTSKTWNYLMYIDDATQRYGKGDGSMWAYGAKANSKRSVNSIPIQLDGIQFVNNQALPGTHGTAIRYNDQVISYDHEGEPIMDYVNAPVSANVSISKAEYDALHLNPDNQVHCTYWTDDTYTEQTSDTGSPYVLYYRKVENPAKLTLTKCKVMNSGSHYDASTREDYSSSAVYIGQYGGDALIYNSIFHSNWGNPLEAFNTRTINNTVALNHGRWILKNSGNVDHIYETGSEEGEGDMLAAGIRRISVKVNRPTYVPRPSKIMNTVLWRNNPTTFGGSTTYGQQFSLDGYVDDSDASSNDIFCRNAYTRFENGVMKLTEGTDYRDPSFVNNYWNTYLSLVNENISYGPNFKDPKLSATDATEGGEIEQRDFSLQPSVRLVDKGDSTIYVNEVFDLAWNPTAELDYLDQHRVSSMNIEVGAIEYPQPLLRVIYVDPTKKENGSGINWGAPMSADNLQNAIDMAAIYSATNGPTDVDRNEAYVFVKGNNETFFPSVILRSGVNVFGSVNPNNVTDYVRYEIDEETGEYRYPNLQSDVAKIIHNRPGLVGTSTDRTIVSSISTGENNTFDTSRPTRIDGVEVSAVSDVNSKGAILKPVLDIDPISKTDGIIPAVAITNVLVDGNDATGNAVNVANINNALIYEVLFRNNKTDNGNYVLNIGSNGYGVNLTVEGLTNGADGKCVYPTTDDQALDHNGQTSHIWYSLYNYSGKAADENTLAAHNYPMSPNLNYQLTEHSKNIDRCPVINPMTKQSETANLVEFINYDTDLDLLANPRVLDVRAPQSAKKLDRGAFETWVIGDDTHGQTLYTDTLPSNYFGNYYPHEGSVVYLLENSNLISEAHSLVPGYLLVKKGASLFAHGQTVKAAYVAVERQVKAQGGLVALPYEMDYNFWSNTSHGPATYSYDENGVLTLTPDANTASYTYNGKTRAAARYQIMNSSSPCWDKVAKDADPVAANRGVFFTCSNDALYRFTGKGVTMKNYLYVEQPQKDAEGNLVTTAKYVVLTQNNNEPTQGMGNLTAEEDMGWNCFGIPYLVSEYKPYEMAYDAKYNHTASTLEYMMHLPKNLWLYYDSLQTVTDFNQVNDWTADNAVNRAGFYLVNSWKDTPADWHLNVIPSLWVGEGMFAQTASFTDEYLYFYLPVFQSTQGAAPVRRLSRVYIGEAIEEEVERGDELQGTVYDLQGRKVQEPRKGGLYVRDGKKVWM